MHASGELLDESIYNDEPEGDANRVGSMCARKRDDVVDRVEQADRFVLLLFFFFCRGRLIISVCWSNEMCKVDNGPIVVGPDEQERHEHDEAGDERVDEHLLGHLCRAHLGSARVHAIDELVDAAVDERELGELVHRIARVALGTQRAQLVAPHEHLAILHLVQARHYAPTQRRRVATQHVDGQRRRNGEHVHIHSQSSLFFRCLMFKNVNNDNNNNKS